MDQYITYNELHAQALFILYVWILQEDSILI
jgi:hypothetical protein